MLKYPKRQARWQRAADQLGYPTVKDMLTDLYRTRTMDQVGKVIGFTAMAVSKMMRRLSISAREPVKRRRK